MIKKPRPRPKTIQPAEKQVRLRVVCQAPPQPARYQAEFGLQDNSATDEWVIHAGTAQSNGDIQFECECRVRENQNTQAPNFLGSFVHGSPAQRFLYLSWRPVGWRAGQSDPPSPSWLRRMKVHLSGITWTQIDQAVSMNGVLEATVVGTDRNGGPSCGSVPLVGSGWKVLRK